MMHVLRPYQINVGRQVVRQEMVSYKGRCYHCRRMNVRCLVSYGVAISPCIFHVMQPKSTREDDPNLTAEKGRT